MNSYIRFSFALMFASSLSASASLTESVSNIADTVNHLGEVTVLEVSAKAPIPLLPLDVKTVGADIIDNSTETNLLPVLQNRIPGMFITERGIAGYGVSGGSAGSVNIRGVGGGNKVLFLIDGMPQWAGVFGHSLPDTYVTNDVQRVEVVSGPSSLLYGSGAMGGSVNLITRRAEHDGLEGAARIMGGSYDTQKYSIQSGYRHGAWQGFAAASYESTDGNRKGMNYWLSNQYVSLGYIFSKYWNVTGNVMLTETKADNPGSVELAKPLEMWSKMFRTTASVSIKNNYDITSGGVQAYYNWGKHKIDDGLKNGNPRDYLFNSKDFNIGVTAFQNIRPWEGNDLSVGVDFKHWGGESWNSAKADGKESPIGDSHVNEIGAYVMMQQAFFSDCLCLNAGGRLEHSSQFGNEWVPQAGFIYRPWTDSRMKFSYGKGFRSPNIRELYMYAARNPELKPESMDNFEMEIRHWVLGYRLNIGLALYYINGDNMIQPVMVNGTSKNMNTGGFINKGYELDATFAVSKKWNITANYAYLHASDNVLAAPRHKVFGEVAYTPRNWQFSLDALGIWRLRTEKSVENYMLLNARVAYTFAFTKPLKLFIKGENLTAAKYQINYGFPMPRATVMAGVEWKF